MKLYTAPATGPNKVTPSEFVSGMLGLPPREERYRQDLERIIRLIEAGADLRGNPPLMVADARKLMAEREALTAKVERELRFLMDRHAA